MRIILALIVGAIFGAGLHISGMTDTNKVQGFLDFFGAWDPTLAFVMGGAIVPMAIAWSLTRKRQPVLGGEFPQRPDPVIDRKLSIGAMLFGAGWGLVGLCPGPAIASISYGGLGGLIFLVAMVAGMRAAPPAKRLLDSRTAAA
ncbi:DUF6691 family protein [Sulfitobacter aestuariivivens]|uniref:YeeE/YedE family protein n=1 Tax=Sulfitobacter aestuariivivens TaxID=2766981 RepID=A0A927HCT0_9RHOB|nr:DUF6691 family protein [Sulfitobacter aestuariivivens]MBD3662902.1 hypothetical protein [Sulfitobacter aestuariivivens]